MATKNSRYDALDGLRGIAAIAACLPQACGLPGQLG